MRTPQLYSSLLTAALLAALIVTSAHATPPLRTWALAGNGTWNTAGNWSPSGVPVGGDSVLVPASFGAHSVTLDVDAPGLNNFMLMSPTATLDFAGHAMSTAGTSTSAGTLLASAATQNFYGPLHTLAGSQVQVFNGSMLNLNTDWQNDGHVVVHSTAGSSPSAVRLYGYQTLSGTGDMQLADPANALFASPSGYTLIQNAGHLIHGAGRVTMGFTNHGTVTADYAAGNTLSIEGLTTSDGTLRATNGAKLLLNAPLTNTTGLLLADGGDIELNGASVSGGSFHTTGASVIETSANSTIGGAINLGGALRVNSGHLLAYAGGTLADSGSIVVHPSGASASTFRLTGYLTLGGPGNLLLGDPALAVLDSPSGYVLTHSAGHTLHGAGTVALYLTNHGLVSADVSGQTLTVNNYATTNDATFQAVGGATLALANATVNNLGGLIRANGGAVTLSTEVVNSGTLAGPNAVTILGPGTSTLSDITNSAPVVINGGAQVNVYGTFPNTGNFRILQPAGAGTATLRLTGYTTFSGPGAIQLTDASRSVLDSPSGYIITNAVDHTVHGTGVAALYFTNHGLVSADVAGQPLSMTYNITNDGTLQAVGGGSLRVGPITLNNTGGTLAATTGDVRLSGTNFGGGTVTSGAGHVVVFDASGNLTANFTNKSTLKVNGGVLLNAAGITLADSGTVQLRSPGDTAAAVVRAVGYTTYGGNGSLVLTHGSQSVLDSPSGYVITNLGPHTIRGTGTIACGLTNQGLLVADQKDSLLTLSYTSFTLPGVQSAVNGGTLAFTNVTPSYAGNTLTGGTWQVGANSTIRFPAADIRHVAATVVLDGAGSLLVSADSSVSALRRLTAVDASGCLALRNGRLLGSLTDLTSSGIVDVGPNSVLTVGSAGAGNYQMDANATYLIEISGRSAGGWGRITVNGNVAINGHVRIRILDGFVPVLTDTFEVMTFAGSRTGEFAIDDSQMVAPHVAMSHIWRGNRMLLVTHYNSGTTDTPPTPGATLPQALSFSARGGAGGPARLELALPHPAQVDVSVFDVTGRRVTTLARDAFAAGHWSWTWNSARDQAASGIYFARARITMGGTTRDLTSRLVVWH